MSEEVGLVHPEEDKAVKRSYGSLLIHKGKDGKAHVGIGWQVIVSNSERIDLYYI